MTTKRMAALLLMLGMVVLSVGLGAAVNSADAESPAPKAVNAGAVAMPSPQEITGDGKGSKLTSLFSVSWAEYLAKLQASTQGRENWEAKAAAACPYGYTVLSSPAPSEGYTPSVFSWGLGWVTCTTTFHISIWIECDPPPTTSTPPPPKFPGWKDADRYMKTKNFVGTPGTDAEYDKAVAAGYEELKQIKTPEQLISLVERNKVQGADYSPFERAKRDGKITKVILPSLEEFQTAHVERKPENR